jgi:hypothetical protein
VYMIYYTVYMIYSVHDIIQCVASYLGTMRGVCTMVRYVFIYGARCEQP